MRVLGGHVAGSRRKLQEDFRAEKSRTLANFHKEMSRLSAPNGKSPVISNRGSQIARFTTNRLENSPNRTFKSRDLWLEPLLKSQQNRSADPFKWLVICDSRFELQIAIAPNRAIWSTLCLALIFLSLLFWNSLLFLFCKVFFAILSVFSSLPGILGVRQG